MLDFIPSRASSFWNSELAYWVPSLFNEMLLEHQSKGKILSELLTGAKQIVIGIESFFRDMSTELKKSGKRQFPSWQHNLGQANSLDRPSYIFTALIYTII